MEYIEKYSKRLNLKWKLKRIAMVGLIVSGLIALSVWTLMQQSGLMVGRVLPGRWGEEMMEKYK